MQTLLAVKARAKARKKEPISKVVYRLIYYNKLLYIAINDSTDSENHESDESDGSILVQGIFACCTNIDTC